MDYIKHSHSTGNNLHHFQWCTKYRYKMFRRIKYAEHCRNILHMIAIAIEELAVMPDHIHIAADIPTDMSQSKAIQLLKGRSSYELFRAIPEFRLRYPKGSLWSKGNFKDSVGRITIETAKKYIRDQQLTLNKFTN